MHLWESVCWLTDYDLGDQLSQLFDEEHHVGAGGLLLSGSVFDVEVDAVAAVQRRPLGDLDGHGLGRFLRG